MQGMQAAKYVLIDFAAVFSFPPVLELGEKTE